MANPPASRSGDPWIVVLGGNQLNSGLHSVARRRGARLLVVDWNDAPPVTGDLHLRLDIKDSTRVVAAVRGLVDQLLFAYTSTDFGTESAAQINATYGLLRPAPSALAAARNKLAMNAVWQRESLLDKRFQHCRSLDELRSFHREVGDVIVKPVVGSSSRGVTVVRENEGGHALAWAHERARAVDPGGEVMVEEYIPGTEFTAEMVGDTEGNVQLLGISRKHHSINAGRSRVATKLHYNAPELPAHLLRRIPDFARRCFRALGLRACLGHFELIMRSDGMLVPLELGARSSGFVATHLVDAAAGERGLLLDTYAQVLRGEPVPNDAVPARRSSMYFFYDFPNGVARRSDISLMDFLPPGITSLASNRSNLIRGSTFGQIDNESERHGFEILAGDRAVLTIDAVERAEAAHRRAFLHEEETTHSPADELAHAAIS